MFEKAVEEEEAEEEGGQEQRNRDPREMTVHGCRRKNEWIASMWCSAQCEKGEWPAAEEELSGGRGELVVKNCRGWHLELDNKTGISQE